MRWQSARRSSNVENRRGSGRAIAGGGGGLLLMAAVVWLLGGDPTQLLVEGASRSIGTHFQQTLPPEQEKEQTDFVSAVLGSTEDVWGNLFQQAGYRYEQPRLVLFTGIVDSACGTAQSASGPFYCPTDRQVYLDLGFFQQLEDTLNAPGDFARAYVIAHEVGHHVQNQLELLQGGSSVETELQADCLAGIWAHQAQREQNLVEDGDIDEALNTASQIGDDRLQQRSQGYVVPDSFTHGSATQRRAAFDTGFRGGKLSACGL